MTFVDPVADEASALICWKIKVEVNITKKSFIMIKILFCQEKCKEYNGIREAKDQCSIKSVGQEQLVSHLYSENYPENYLEKCSFKCVNSLHENIQTI